MTEIDLTQFSEHTTGPWRLDETDGCLTIHFSTLMSASFNMLSGEFASNIRLMAAAPDLLAAYKAALARAERLDRELEVLSQSHKTIAHQLADEHCRAEAAEHRRDEAFTAGAEAMREAIYNYVYDEAEAMKEQAYNLIEHHSFRPGGRGVSNEAKRKGFIRDRQQIAEKLFIDAAHIRTLPIPAQEGK